MNNISFDKIFGFGCMRLPMKDDKVDNSEFCKMIDIFMQNGFNYFDTAHGYLGGKSEIAIRECLASRYNREDYLLTNKLSNSFFETKEEIIPLFNEQLAACGVDYFDFYLMHSQNARIYEKYKKTEAYKVALELKKQGKIKHLGISFHDKADVLDLILTENPEVEIVQIQFNYIDYDDPAVEGKKCYEVARKHGKPVIVMEPVKGGSLVNLPEDANAILDSVRTCSNAGYALRFAAGFEGVVMVLSGMGNTEMMLDNISTMKDFAPLNESENKAIEEVVSILRSKDVIPCTDCKYCVDEGCPKKIAIPGLFACMNSKNTYKNWNSEYYYDIYTKNGGKASDCIGCGKCERICPQQLPIRELLKNIAKEFEQDL